MPGRDAVRPLYRLPAAHAIVVEDNISGPVVGNSPKLRWLPATEPDLTARPPVTHVFVLGPSHDSSADIRVSPLGGRERFLALLDHRFCLRLHHIERAARELDQLVRLANSAQFWSLSYTRDFDRLDHTLDAILEVAG